MRDRKQELLLKQERLDYWGLFGTTAKKYFDEDRLIPFDNSYNYGDFQEGGDY